VVVFPTAAWTSDQARWAVEFALSSGLTVITHVSADRVDELRILADAGFTTARREVKVEVDLEAALASIRDAHLPPGVGVISAADADVDRLRELDDALRDDIPGTDGWHSTPEEFADETFSVPAFNPATYLVAVKEDTGAYIGLVRIWMNRSGPRIGMFGVLRAHRRRGITLTLLARCLVAVRDAGHGTVTSEYDQENKASAGIFERLGARQTGSTMELATERLKA
jgi:RimJ/RimL family protein N-acetyltransferase